MKTGMKKKTLKIKNNKLILKEGWGDVAANMATDGSWTKIAKVALKGALELTKGVWNTGFKLPAKLANAMWNNKSIADVMKEWEREDKKIKQAQKNIIASTGVEGTVDAFIGMCNPAALALDKWNNYHDDEAKRKFNLGSIKVWNNTMGRISKDLIIDDEEASDVVVAKINYSNFVLAVAKKGLNINVSSQDYLGSYEDFKKMKKPSFNSYIDPTNKISKSSDNFKIFIKFLDEMSTSSTGEFNSVVYSSRNFKDYVEKIIGLEQYKKLKSKLFENILKSKVSTDQASSIIISENLSSTINDIAAFIKGAENLNKNFKIFLRNNGGSSVEETPAEEKPAEETPAEAPSAPVNDNFSSKKQLIIKNNKLIKSIILENSEKEKVKEAFIKKGSVFYLDHISFLIQVRFLIVLKMSMLKSAYIYSLYKDFSENIENKNYVVTENSNTSSIKADFNKLNALLENIILYCNTFKKEKKLLPASGSSLYSLESDFKKSGLSESEVFKEINSSINLDDNAFAEQLLESFAKALDKDKEEIKSSLEDDDLNNVYRLLTTASFYKEMTENEEINKSVDIQQNNSNNIYNLIQKISSTASQIVNKENFKEVFINLEGTIRAKECFKLLENLDLEFNKNTESINNFKAIFDTKRIEPILKQKEKELEEVLSIDKNSNPDNNESEKDFTEDGLSYTLAKSNKYATTGILNLEDDNEESN